MPAVRSIGTAVLLVLAAAGWTHPARAQSLASYTSNTTDLNALMSAVGSSQLPLQGTYIDSTLQFGQFVQSAQYSASTLVATCPPSSCSPLVGLPMAGAGQNADQAFRAIANGSDDSMIVGVLQAYADQGYKNIILRPGFEMNGDWFAWSVNASNAADFQAAFQRIAAISHSFGGAHVAVNFNPSSGASIPIQDYYPGNASVDSIGLDIYGEPWQSDDAPNDPTGGPTNLTFDYLAQFAKENGKPFSLPETGSATSDTTFPQQLAQAILATGTPIQFAGLWDNDGSGPATWTNDPAASAAWAQVAAVISGSSPVSAGVAGAGADPAVTDPTVSPPIAADLPAAAAVPAGSPTPDVSPGDPNLPQITAVDAATLRDGGAPSYVASIPPEDADGPSLSAPTSTSRPAEVVPAIGGEPGGMATGDPVASRLSGSPPQQVIPTFGSNASGPSGPSDIMQPAAFAQPGLSTQPAVLVDPSSDADLQLLTGQTYGATAIATAADLGVNPSSVAAIAQIESGFRNIGTANGATTATGPWQFTQGTFNNVSANNDLGFSASSLTDPNAQAVEAPYYLQQIAGTIGAATGQPATTLEAYGGWVFGPTPGAQIAMANPSTPLSQLISAQSLANNGMSGWTVGTFRTAFAAKLGPAANQTVLTAAGSL